MTRYLLLGTLAVCAGGCGVNSALGFACTEEFPCPGSLTCDPTGHCAAACPEGLTSCSGFCTDTDTDVNNCGGCSKQCPGEACAYWATMDWQFTSEDDCVSQITSVCSDAGTHAAACVAAANPSNAGQCSAGMCIQTVDNADGVNCGKVGETCPAPDAGFCAGDGCTAADCAATGNLVCFASECNYLEVQCACFQC